jgi:hypothetical protein
LSDDANSFVRRWILGASLILVVVSILHPTNSGSGRYPTDFKSDRRADIARALEIFGRRLTNDQSSLINSNCVEAVRILLDVVDNLSVPLHSMAAVQNSVRAMVGRVKACLVQFGEHHSYHM